MAFFIGGILMILATLAAIIAVPLTMIFEALKNSKKV